MQAKLITVQLRNKLFWTKIKNVRNRSKNRVNGAVLDKMGNLMVVVNKEVHQHVECELSVNDTITLSAPTESTSK